MEKYDLIVIGGGVSGMTSATVALEDGIKKVMIIERESSLGGFLRQCIHNGFGNKRLKTEITGPEYINLIYIQNYLPIIIAFAFNNRVKVSSVVSMAFDFLHCRHVRIMLPFMIFNSISSLPHAQEILCDSCKACRRSIIA